MKKKILFSFIIWVVAIQACQDQLEIINPNKPTPESARTERGIIALAQGGLYINGFQETKYGGNLFNLVLGFHDRMGDIISSPYDWHFLSCPDNIMLDNGTNLVSINNNGQVGFLRDINNPTSQANPLFYEWAFMYNLNGAMNNVLMNVDLIMMNEVKMNTLKAWAYFWKGFAYSRIGSMYYSGIINDLPNVTNNLYVINNDLLAEAEKNFRKAEEFLISLAANDDFTYTMNSLIPSVCKFGKGNPPSAQEWLRNINTLRARNILVNTSTELMNAEKWTMVLSLSANGVQQSDNTFTIRTDDLGNLLNGFVASSTIGSPVDGGGIYKISERFIQDFKVGDLRLINNFDQITPWIAEEDRGTGLNTRYILIDEGKGNGSMVYCSQEVGAHELYIAGSYEENILMQAEANIYLGNIDAGLALIDELRDYQGAGLAPVANTGLTSDQAKEELRRERRVALAFRGFSFYDARRWGVLENGRTGCVVVDFDGTVNTNAKIDYGYLDYWDVPIAELFYNPPAEGSAPVVNPKQ